MKIALASPYDYAYPGGVTEHIGHLAHEFQRTGHEVHIIAPCSDEPPSDFPFHRLGIPFALPANGSVARIGLSTRLSQEVRETLASGAFDIIHLHEPLVPMLPLAVLRASRTTNVGTFHTFRNSTLAYLSAKPFLEYFFRKLHGKIAVSESARDFVAEHFPGQYRIIPNGIDVEQFSRPRPPIPELNDGRLNVLFLGRLEKRKGLSHLLRAWVRVREEVPEARLVVVGGGQGLAHYQKFVQARVSDDIVFTGLVSDEDKVRYYQSADVFCAPSTGGESFGVVLLEAMAAGRAIVATDIPGYRGVVTDGKEGLLVPPKNSDLLAQALLQALRDPELRSRLGSNGRQTAQHYTWKRVSSQVLDYYSETIHRRALLDRLKQPRFRRVRRVASGVVHLLSH
ncbi:MAG: glycosyltransferase family 1 protein [Chloroflexi bacterium]|nr:glycosyltransferase family 1 protein [Chloroflexota bacterium]